MVKLDVFIQLLKKVNICDQVVNHSLKIPGNPYEKSEISYALGFSRHDVPSFSPFVATWMNIVTWQAFSSLVWTRLQPEIPLISYAKCWSDWPLACSHRINKLYLVIILLLADFSSSVNLTSDIWESLCAFGDFECLVWRLMKSLMWTLLPSCIAISGSLNMVKVTLKT